MGAAAEETSSEFQNKGTRQGSGISSFRNALGNFFLTHCPKYFFLAKFVPEIMLKVSDACDILY